MALPFTIDQFLGVFRDYNLAVWPMQAVLYFMAAACIFLVFKRIKNRNRIIAGILAFLWLWVGAVYHITFFSAINKPAYVFGGLFIVQGLLLIYAGFADKLSFAFKKNIYGFTGSFFIIYALIIYPALNYVFGHGWPENPTFGLPCPTTIFTFGILLLTGKKVPKYLLIVPLLWSLIGVSAAINLGIWEDIMLVVAGILGTILIWMRDRKINAL